MKKTLTPPFITSLSCSEEEVDRLSDIVPDDASRNLIKQQLLADETAELEIIKKIGDPTMSLCKCISFLMLDRGWKKGLDFFEKTGLHENYFQRIINDADNGMKKPTLWAICIGLRLPLHVIIRLFKKCKFQLDPDHDPDKTYIRILELMPGMPVSVVNELLSQCGKIDLMLGSTER